MSESAPDFISDQPLIQQITELALEKKAINPLVLDVRGLSSVADFFLICGGDSEPQVKAIADTIRKGTDHKPRHLEGYENLNWVLLDYFDVVVHIFGKEERDFYNIEKLWADAPRIDLIDEATEATNQ